MLKKGEFMKVLGLLLVSLSFQYSMAQDYTADTQEINSVLQANTVSASFHYCFAGKMTCRTLVQLKNKVSNEAASAFYDVFYSSERAVGSTGYFIKNESQPTYHAMLDDVFDGQVVINHKFVENLNLQITFDSNHFPTIHDMHIKKIGTTRYLIATMSYSATQATLIGTEFDTANTTFSAPLSLTYPRINP